MSDAYDRNVRREEILAALGHRVPEETAQRELVARRTGSNSGFLDRLVAEYFTHGSIPVRLKDVGKSLFGVPTDESTLTWGSNASHYAQAIGVAFPPGTPGTTFITEIGTPATVQSEQLVHVNRSRPTTFSLMAVVKMGTGWTGEASTVILVQWFVGVGQGKVTINRLFTIAAPTDNSQPVFDVIQVPMQAAQCQITVALTPALSVAKSLDLTALAAPVVQ